VAQRVDVGRHRLYFVVADGADADLVGRVVARPGEVQAGLVTAFIGAPVFLAVILRRRIVPL